MCCPSNGSIAAAAINPFHTDSSVKKQIESHISSCEVCNEEYDRLVQMRKALEATGFDPTHQFI